MNVAIVHAPQLFEAVLKALVRRLGGDVTLSHEELNTDHAATATIADDGQSIRLTALRQGEIQ